MTLRIKTLGVLLVAFVGLLAVVFVTSRILLLDRFASLENDNVSTNIQRVLSSLSDDVAELDAELSNWVKLVDMSNVQADPDANFSRLLTDALTNIQINFTMIVDTSDRIIFRKAVDVQRGEDVPFTLSFQEHFADHDLLLRHSAPDSRVMGFISLPEGPMLVASRPVPDSSNDNPVGGTMLFVRHMTSAQIEALARSTQLSLAIRRVAEVDLPLDFQEALPAISAKDPTVIRRLNNDQVAGYAVLKDVYGNPSAVIRVDIPSTIFRQGQTTLAYLLVSVAVVGLLFVVLTMLGLEKFVLSRVARLSRDVDDIAATARHSARVSVVGRDELSKLGGGINWMLGRLEEFHSVAVETERIRGEEALEMERVRAEEEAATARSKVLERSRSRILAVSESLRKEIARRLHGPIQSKLIVMLHSIDRLTQASPEEIGGAVAGIREELEDLIENDIRKLSVIVYPDILRRGLIPALQSLGDRVQREIPLEMDLDQEFAKREKTDSKIIPEGMKLSAYRVAEEALTNAIKHAQARKVAVKLEQLKDGWLRVRVSDDGRGFDVESE